MILKAAKS